MDHRRETRDSARRDPLSLARESIRFVAPLRNSWPGCLAEQRPRGIGLGSDGLDLPASLVLGSRPYSVPAPWGYPSQHGHCGTLAPTEFDTSASKPTAS